MKTVNAGGMPTATRIFSRGCGFAEGNHDKMEMILFFRRRRLLLFRGMSGLLAGVPCLLVAAAKRLG